MENSSLNAPWKSIPFDREATIEDFPEENEIVLIEFGDGSLPTTAIFSRLYGFHRLEKNKLIRYGRVKCWMSFPYPFK